MAKTSVELIENPDILATLAKAGNRRPRLVIGFAAETSKMFSRSAALKLRRKNCDWIVANEVGAGKGFDSDDNEVTLLRRGAKGETVSFAWPRQSKAQIARQLARRNLRTPRLRNAVKKVGTKNGITLLR